MLLANQNKHKQLEIIQYRYFKTLKFKSKVAMKKFKIH